MNWLQSFFALQFIWVAFGFPIGGSKGVPEEADSFKLSPLEIDREPKVQLPTKSRPFQPTNKRIEEVSEMLESKFNKKSVPKKVKHFRVGEKKPERKSEIRFYEAKQQPEVLYRAMSNSFLSSFVPLIPFIPRNLEPPTRMFEQATRFIVPPVTIEVLPRSRTKYVLKPNSLDY